MYQVVGNTNTRTFRVLWAMHEMGLDFEHIAAPARSPEVLAVNPSGKVPALIVDGTPIIDSVAILTYLADKHGQLTYPAGTMERAQQDSLTHSFWMNLTRLFGQRHAIHSFYLSKNVFQKSRKPYAGNSPDQSS